MKYNGKRASKILPLQYKTAHYDCTTTTHSLSLSLIHKYIQKKESSIITILVHKNAMKFIWECDKKKNKKERETTQIMSAILALKCHQLTVE